MKTTTYLSGGVVIKSRPEPTPIEKTRTALVLACTAYAYTHKGMLIESNKEMHACIDDCIGFVSKGYTLRTAVVMTFGGNLRDMLLARIDRPAGRRMINRGHYSNHQEGAL